MSVAHVLGLPDTTWRTKSEARDAYDKARSILRGQGGDTITVWDWWVRWTTDALFARPKRSTDIHNKERTRAFAERYRDRPIGSINDVVVSEWLAGGKRNSTVPALKAMFNDALSAQGGRLVKVNPFLGLKLSRSKGNRHRQPPSQEQMEQLISVARDITPPSFAAYLEFACLTGARPGELDALRWPAVRFADGEVDILQQYNHKLREFTEPKYGPYTLALVSRAAQVLRNLKRAKGDDEFVFTTLTGNHYTVSSRAHHWDRVRCSAGMPRMTLYLATRHYFGWYALNVLGLEPHIIAEQLGHRDGGRLVVSLYGHPDASRARRLIREAYDATGTITPLRRREGL